MKRLLPLLVFLGSVGYAEPPLKVSFHCLWWSAAQMHNLDIEKPPPKETDVELKKWEYSDPVGVPNPDEITLVAEVGPAKSELYLSLWKALEDKTIKARAGDNAIRTLHADLKAASEQYGFPTKTGNRKLDAALKHMPESNGLFGRAAGRRRLPGARARR